MELYRVIYGRVMIQRDGQTRATLQAQACLTRGPRDTAPTVKRSNARAV